MIDMQQSNMRMLPFKSIAAALLFSVILGPVGLLYASLWGGVAMIILGFIVICNKSSVGTLLVWLISCIWGVAAANRHNQHLLKKIIK